MDDSPAGMDLDEIDPDLASGILAREWCEVCCRRKRGMCADHQGDVQPEMANLMRLGWKATELHAEINRKTRNWSEFLWQFRERLMDRRKGDYRHKKPWDDVPQAGAEMSEVTKKMLERRREHEEQRKAALSAEELREMFKRHGYRPNGTA